MNRISKHVNEFFAQNLRVLDEDIFAESQCMNEHGASVVLNLTS